MRSYCLIVSAYSSTDHTFLQSFTFFFANCFFSCAAVIINRNEKITEKRKKDARVYSSIQIKKPPCSTVKSILYIYIYIFAFVWSCTDSLSHIKAICFTSSGISWATWPTLVQLHHPISLFLSRIAYYGTFFTYSFTVH